MNRLSRQDRARALALMSEGTSIRAIARMTGFSKNTILNLLANAGTALARYQDDVFRNLSCRRIRIVDIWSFGVSGATENAADYGTYAIWTWVAVDADTRLVPSWLMGTRNESSVRRFMTDLMGRVDQRVELTSDRSSADSEAVFDATFDTDVGDGRPVKLCAGTRKGKEMEHLRSTSSVEPSILSSHLSESELPNPFLKKAQSHSDSISFYFMHYNFVRIHETLGVTPAMAAEVADKPWTLMDVVQVIDDFGDGPRKEMRKAI